MTSPRPAGKRRRCPLCRVEIEADLPEPPGDAACPHCDCWLRESAELLLQFQHRLGLMLGVAPSKIRPDSSLASDLGGESLDVAELVMDLEEEYDLTIPPDLARGMKTLADAVRFLADQRHERRT